MQKAVDKRELGALVDHLCSHYQTPDTPGVCVGVIQDGEMIFCKGYGSANLEYGIPIHGDTVFQCGSVAKQFTAACIALLIEQGDLSLKNPITDHLPLEGEPWSILTIENLVYMTDGLLDVYDTASLICGIREDDFFTKEEFWDFIRSADWLCFHAGDKWNYSNTAYFLLGEIVRHVSGQSLSEFADNKIFQPLGMKHTFFRDDRSKIIPNRAVGYSSYEHVHFNDDVPAYSTAGCGLSINAENMDVPGAGQLWSTVNDLLLWDRNFYDNRLGQRDHRFIQLITESGRLNDGTTTGYGMGHFNFSKNGYRHISHGGLATGYSCFVDRVMEQRVSVIILGNHSDIIYKIWVDEVSDGIIDKIMTCFLPKIGAEEPVKLQDTSKEILAETPHTEACGTYQNPDLTEYEGLYHNNRLNVTYEVVSRNEELFVRNRNHHHTALDMAYKPAILDSFVAGNAYISHYCLTFFRDSGNRIHHFSYCSDMNSQLESFLFMRI